MMEQKLYPAGRGSSAYGAGSAVFSEEPATRSSELVLLDTPPFCDSCFSTCEASASLETADGRFGGFVDGDELISVDRREVTLFELSQSVQLLRLPLLVPLLLLVLVLMMPLT